MFLVNQIAGFYKLVVLLLLGVARRVHSAQNNKIVISWQFLKKKGRGEVHVLHVNQHHTILKTDIINLRGHCQTCSKYQNNFAKSLQYRKKEVRDEVYFCVDEHQSYL